MAQLDDPIDEISARLMMHEFVLEVAIANLLARADRDQAAQAKRDIIDRMRTPRPDSLEDFEKDPQLRAIADRSAEMAQRFVQKVGEREDDIRR